MSDDLREQLAEALTYKPGSSAYDYADRVLPIVWEYAVECQRAETQRFAIIAERCDRLAADASRDPGMYSGPADAVVSVRTRELLAAELRSWLYETRNVELSRAPGEMADDLLQWLQAQPCGNCGGDVESCDCDES